MKKFFTLSFFSLTFALVANTAMAQNEVYWREGFTNNIGNINSQSSAAPTTPTVDTGDAGLWIMYNAYRTTGTACASYEVGHIRSIKTAAGSGLIPYIVTPKVSFGIKEVHFSSAGNNKIISIEKTSSAAADNDAAGVAAATWTLVGTYTRNNCQAAFGDTTVLVNDASATRVRFLAKENYQVDIDSIWLTSVNPITTTPIRFNNLNVVNSNGLAKVTFACQDETNVKEYIVERSSNGSAFATVGRLNSAGTAKYTIMDNAPYAGVSYYRVIAVYADGKSVLSSVVKLSATSKAADLVVAPNPVRGSNLNLQFNNFVKGSYTVNIYNSVSQKVYTKVINHDGGSSLQQLVLPAAVKGGMYNLQLLGDAVKITKTLVVE